MLEASPELSNWLGISLGISVFAINLIWFLAKAHLRGIGFDSDNFRHHFRDLIRLAQTARRGKTPEIRYRSGLYLAILLIGTVFLVIGFWWFLQTR